MDFVIFLRVVTDGRCLTLDEGECGYSYDPRVSVDVLLMEEYWAGAIDHDGWIIIARRLRGEYSPSHTLIVGYGQKAEKMVRACHNFFGVGRANSGKHIWQWTASSLMAVECLRIIEPHLILKKEQANLGIEFQEARLDFRGGFPPRRISSEEFKKRDGYYLRMKELNGGGG